MSGRSAESLSDSSSMCWTCWWPPPPPPPPITWEHGVFLCFRGKDTREGFTSHLFQALVSSGINTFMDDRLPKGRDISELLDRIEKSRVSVVIFSEKFASSPWCLDELVKILECKERMGQEVLPVFYKVPPSQLREPRGKTAEHLAKHGEKYGPNSEKIEQWRHAVKNFADLHGWHFTHGTESELVSKIVESVQSIPDLKITGVQPDHVSLQVDDPASLTEVSPVLGKVARVAAAIVAFAFIALWVYLFVSLNPIATLREHLSASHEMLPGGIPRRTCQIFTPDNQTKPCDETLLKTIFPGR